MAKQLRQMIRNMNIRKKIIFYTYVFIAPILLLICSAIAVFQYSTTSEEYKQLQKNSVSSLAASLDIIQSDVYYLSLNMAINKDIRSILTLEDAASLDTTQNFWIHSTPVQLIEEIVALKGYIKTISIYPENGAMPYLRCLDSSSYISELSQIRDSDIYQKTLERRGKGLWVQISRGNGSIYQANRTKKLVLCREVYDLAQKEPLGFLTVGISAEEIEKLCCNALQSEQEGILFFNCLGDNIGSYGQIDEQTVEYIKNNILPEGEEYHGIFRRRELFVQQIGEEGGYVCKIVPEKTFFDFFSEIVYMPAVLLLGIMLGLLPVLLIVSSIISRPLQDVCEAMGHFCQGDFKQQVEILTNDEVGQVAACFNRMVKDFERLINKNYVMVLKERESELAVLQAQINPHFLYNALDSIYWQAVNADDEGTAESIYELSQLFRLALGQGKKMVTVEMEAELLQRYLEIQKLRFLQQMEYHIEMEPEILYEKIPKLILQPFVENAVVHGMQSQDEICVITVTGKYQDNKVEFKIVDTGVGMTEEQLKKIWEKDTEHVFSGQRIGRYAIRNVRERLELIYGEDFRLEIESREGEGTVVTIVVPAGSGDEEYGS